jgi:hypothetical protein
MHKIMEKLLSLTNNYQNSIVHKIMGGTTFTGILLSGLHVNQIMTSQISFGREGLLAHGTFKWSVSFVNDTVMS